MKAKRQLAARVIAVLLFVALAAGFVFAGVPCLATGPEIVSVISQNTSPIAKNLELETFKGIAISGKLAATDPDGDEVIFEITDLPKKGSVEAQSDGSFVYTPQEGKKGTDSFSYTAVDPFGNRSESATVSISIQKQSAKITYSDMQGNSSNYSALVLAEKGVFMGEKLGNEYFFRPDTSVTRSEFLALCLAVTGTETLEGITRTGFSDDASIPMWAKPYVSTGLMAGVITGYRDSDGRLVFNAEEPITYSEAAMILNNVLRLTDVESVMSVSVLDEAAPVWAYQAEVNLAACNIMPAHGASSYTETLTRAGAADLLAASLSHIEARDSGISLLSWAKQ